MVFSCRCRWDHHHARKLLATGLIPYKKLFSWPFWGTRSMPNFTTRNPSWKNWNNNPPWQRIELSTSGSGITGLVSRSGWNFCLIVQINFFLTWVKIWLLLEKYQYHHLVCIWSMYTYFRRTKSFFQFPPPFWPLLDLTVTFKKGHIFLVSIIVKVQLFQTRIN